MCGPGGDLRLWGIQSSSKYAFLFQGNMDRSILCHVGVLPAGFECHDFCAQYQKIQFRYATSIGTIPRFQFCSQYSRACFRNKNTCHVAVLQEGHRQADGAPVSIQYGRTNSTGKNRMIKMFHTMADSLGKPVPTTSVRTLSQLPPNIFSSYPQ